jgi:hypothetical protein
MLLCHAVSTNSPYFPVNLLQSTTS